MTAGQRRVFEIVVHPELCTACLTCQLRCSLRLKRSANPSKAAIVIGISEITVGSDIAFTPECDDCALCARYCPYGTLEMRRKVDRTRQ